MNAEELFKELKTDTSENIIKQLKQLFFSRKIKELVTDKDTAAINLEENRIMLDDFIANIEQELPEAELIYYMKSIPRWIKMKNVDFEFEAFAIHFYDRTISFRSFYAIENIANLLRKFNRVMPIWESEFRNFCTENQQKINELESRRLISSSNKLNVVKEYLQRKAFDTAIMNRRLLPDMNDSVVDALIKDKKGLQNYKFSFCGGRDGDMRLDFNVGGSCLIGLCSAEVLLEIDRQIPQWIEEGKELEREFDKQEKIKQINENSTKVLVKSKMHELGCEYKFNQKEQDYRYQQSKKPIEYILEVKLQKGRKLVVTIPSNNLNRVRKTLDSLEASINAINSVPMNHRIKFQFVGNEDWTKE